MNTVPIQKGHPRGLYVLFFTEMWERFGYYLMVGILYLYLHDTVANGGRGMDVSMAADITGSYIALVYLTPFLGGLIADRYIGYRLSIFLGGSLMALGYFLMSVPNSGALLYGALACVIVGNGFFKPNIRTLLGNIYNKEELKPKKTSPIISFTWVLILAPLSAILLRHSCASIIPGDMHLQLPDSVCCFQSSSRIRPEICKTCGCDKAGTERRYVVFKDNVICVPSPPAPVSSAGLLWAKIISWIAFK
jgi:MFS family permease